MAFYGMLVVAAIAVSLLALHSAQLYTSALNNSYGQAAAYDRMVGLEAFAAMANESGMNISTPNQYQNWKAALEASASQDGMALEFTNSAVVVSEGGGHPAFIEVDVGIAHGQDSGNG